MIRIVALVIGLLFSGFALGQVAKVKQFDNTVKPGFSSELQASYSDTENTTKYSLFSGDAAAFYKFDSKDVLSLSFGREFGKIEGDRYVDTNNEHIQFTKAVWILGVDVFGQRNADYFDPYESQIYVGAGPHISLYDNAGTSLIVGGAYAHKITAFKDTEIKDKANDFGLLYVASKIRLTPNLTVAETLRGQQQYDNTEEFLKLENYKVSSETAALVDVTPNVAFKMAYEAIWYKLPEMDNNKRESSNLKSGISIKL